MDMALILRRPVHSVLVLLRIEYNTWYCQRVLCTSRQKIPATPLHTHSMVSQHHPPPSVYFYSTPYSILLQYSHRQHMDHTHTPAKTTRSTSYNNIPFSSYIVPVQSTEYRDTQGNSYPMVPLRPSQGSQLALANHRTEAGRDECLGNIYGRSPYPFFFFSSLFSAMVGQVLVLETLEWFIGWCVYCYGLEYVYWAHADGWEVSLMQRVRYLDTGYKYKYGVRYTGYSYRAVLVASPVLHTLYPVGSVIDHHQLRGDIRSNLLFFSPSPSETASALLFPFYFQYASASTSASAPACSGTSYHSIVALAACP